jgi:hypothetical protein
MFDYVLSEGVSFDTPAYVHLRYLLNGGIRFADRLHLFSLIWFAVTSLFIKTLKDSSKFYVERYNTAFEQISDDKIKMKLNYFHERFTNTVLEYLICSSLLLMFVILVSLPIIVFKEIIKSGLKSVKELHRVIKIKVKNTEIFKPLISTAETRSYATVKN